MVLYNAATNDIIDEQKRRIGKKMNSTPTKAWLDKDQLNPTAEFDGSGDLVSRSAHSTKKHAPPYMILVAFLLLTPCVGCQNKTSSPSQKMTMTPGVGTCINKAPAMVQNTKHGQEWRCTSTFHHAITTLYYSMFLPKMKSPHATDTRWQLARSWHRGKLHGKEYIWIPGGQLGC